MKDDQLDAARHNLLRQAEALRQQGRRHELAATLRSLGEVERQLPDAGDARRYYEEAVALFREFDDVLRLAHTVRHLGDVHHDAGDSALAEACYVEALSLYRSHGKDRPLDHANAVRRLAVLREEASEMDEATRLWEEAHELYAAVDVQPGVAESATRLARLAHRRGDTERSREWLARAGAAADRSGDSETGRRT